MKIAVLGGSFNPIHIGHLALADEVCESLGYDRVLFIPAYNPPHKELQTLVTREDRMEMVRLACRDDPRFIAEACEMERGGISYTYDTVCVLEEKYRDVREGKIALILGDDLHSGFHLWYKAEELSQKCDLILARRPPLSLGKASVANHARGAYGNLPQEFDVSKEVLFKNALFIQNPFLSISSTDIRERCSEGKSFRYLVPQKVFEYIKNGGLYAAH